MSEEIHCLEQTESVCPVCLKKIPAKRVLISEDIFLDKECPDHGNFRTIIWRGERPAFQAWNKDKKTLELKYYQTEGKRGCPYDCGLCPEHRQQTCCVLIEVTGRCNQKCPFCFAESSGNHADPTRTEVEDALRFLRSQGITFLHFSGGEPTLRDDLPDLTALAKELGFSYLQLNTNGLRLARDKQYVKQLAGAGLSSVFLQFDGTKDEIYKQIRGESLLQIKEAAIQNCGQNNLGVILVPTLIPGVNTDNLGEIIDYGIQRSPFVRGVHFQPVSYFGRYPEIPLNQDRFTLPEVMQAIEEQTAGMIKVEHFGPSGCDHSFCTFHGDFVIMPGEKIKPLKLPTSCCSCQDLKQRSNQAVVNKQNYVARRWAMPQSREQDNAVEKGQGLGEWEIYISRVQNHSFALSGMAFQDCWNLDLDRLRDCSLHVLSPDKKIVPFCAYYLTNQNGHGLYREIEIK